MATLTQSQLMMYASAVGFPNPPLMAAIAMAESGGRTTVINSLGCVGLWQIKQPDWVKSHPNWTVSWLQNPMHNAEAAKVVFDAQGYDAWETYTDKAYLKYYSGSSSTVVDASSSRPWWESLLLGPEGSKSPLQMFGGPSVSQLGGDLSGLSSIATDFDDVGKWISNPTNWEHVLYVVGGFALLIVGLSIAVKPLANSAIASAPQAQLLKKVVGK